MTIRLPPEEELRIIRTLYQGLFSEGTFYVSDLTKMLDIAHKRDRLSDELYAFLRTLHCVKYSILGEAITEDLKETTSALLDIPRSELEQVKHFTSKPHKKEIPVEEAAVKQPFSARLKQLVLNVSNR